VQSGSWKDLFLTGTCIAFSSAKKCIISHFIESLKILLDLYNFCLCNSLLIQASIWTFSKNYCVELELPIFELTIAGAQILTTTWKRKKHKPLFGAAMSSSRVTRFFETGHSHESMLLRAKEATYGYYHARPGLKPMQLHWAPRYGVWVDCSFLPDTPCAWEFSRNAM